MAGWQDAPVIGGQQAAPAAAPPAQASAWQSAPVVGGTPVGAGDDSFTPGYTDANGVKHPPHIVVHATRIQPPGGPAEPSTTAEPGSADYAAWAVQQAKAGNALPQVSPTPPEWHPEDNIPAPLRSFSTHAVESVPVIGAMLQRSNADNPEWQAVNQSADRQAPAAAVAGDVFGSVAPLIAGGEIPAIAKGLGMASDIANPILNLAARTGASAASSAALGGADTLVRTGDAGQAAQDALTSGAVGAVLPGAGDLIGGATRAVGGRIARTVDDLFNPDKAAQRSVAAAIEQDLRAGPGMTRADTSAAAQNGQPVINADRFGGNVRSLARTAGNFDPSAEAALKDATQQRFLTQNQRADDFVRRVSGGNVDDLALHEQMANATRKSNGRAYDAAYAAPGADSVWTPEIKQLFQSPDFVSAVKGATRTAANDAAVTGRRAVRNPFQFNADGSISLRANADGSKATPSLEFWDVVQRNLRGASEKAFAAGDKQLGGQLKDMRTQLVSGLDKTVPQFGKARAGAAAAFGAEDALQAGRNFVTQTKAIPEAKAAYAKFTPPERKAFAVGFSSSLIDKIGAARDGVNVIDQVFGSPASRAQVELALGKPAAAELEQFVRIENIMQQTKNAVGGNSSTARQLAAMGAIGGVGGGLVGGWDWKNVGAGASIGMAARMGAKVLGQKIDERVMQRVAQMLSSGDPKALNLAVKMAAHNQQAALAIKAIQHGLQAAAQAAAIAVPSGAAAAQ